MLLIQPGPNPTIHLAISSWQAMCSSNPVTYWHVALHSYEKNYIKHFCNNMSHKSKNKSIFEVLQTEVSLYVRKLNVF